MKTKRLQNRFGPAIVVLSAFLITGKADAFAAGEKEKTPAENVAIAKSRNQISFLRNAAIEKLAGIADAAVLRDARVGDELIAIAKPDSARLDDMFVRIDAIRALGRLQQNADRLLKDRYIPVLVPVLRDVKEHPLVRRAVAGVFGETLENNKTAHLDGTAYQALQEVARSRTDTNIALRCAAIKSVGMFGAAEGLDILVGLLGDTEQRIREEAAGALFVLLGQAGNLEIPVPAVNKLIEMLGNKEMAADLRVNVARVLAQLMRDGNVQARQAMPAIANLVTRAQEVKLVKGSVEALGLIGNAEAVEPLKTAYADFLPPPSAVAAPGADAAVAANADKPQDAEARLAVVYALVSVLSTQNSRTQLDAKAVHESAALLVKVVDDDPSSTVREAAVFAMRYLYPVKFKGEHKATIDALVYCLRQPGTSEALKDKIIESLEAITGQSFNKDAKRWNDWFEVAFNVRPRANR